MNSPTTVSRRNRHPAMDVAAATVSIALHALLLAPVLWGGSRHRTHTPEVLGDSQSASQSGSAGAMTVELLEEASPEVKEQSARSEPSLFSSADLQAALDAVPPPHLPDIEAVSSETANGAPAPGDDATGAMLYGRYVGQISARIERAWLKPRTPIGAEIFTCRVGVLQDAAGKVLEVAPSGCNGDERWRSSLVRAVETASPLPAPPDPKVFRRQIELNFTAAQYVAGGSTEGFEPESRMAMNLPTPKDHGPNTPNVIDRLRALKEGKPGTVDLRLGSGAQPR